MLVPSHLCCVLGRGRQVCSSNTTAYTRNKVTYLQVNYSWRISMVWLDPPQLAHMNEWQKCEILYCNFETHLIYHWQLNWPGKNVLQVRICAVSVLYYRSLTKECPPLKKRLPLTFGLIFCIGSKFTWVSVHPGASQGVSFAWLMGCTWLDFNTADGSTVRYCLSDCLLPRHRLAVHDMGALSWLNVEALERAPTPLLVDL